MMREFLAFILFVSGYCVYGQTLEDKHHRVLVLLDASLSMNEPSEGYATKYTAASDFIIRLIDSIYNRNDEVEFGLRVYGHQYLASARQCFDTKLEVQFSRDNIEQMKMRLADVKPRGISNTYTALKEALEYDISSTNNYEYHVLIITDGGEACSGDDVCSLNDLLKYKNISTPCIVSTSNTLKYPCFTTGAIQMVKSNTDFTVNYYVKQCLLIPEKHIHKNTAYSEPIKEAVVDIKPYTSSVIRPLAASNSNQLIVQQKAPKPKKAAAPDKIETKAKGFLKITHTTSKPTATDIYQQNNDTYLLYKTINAVPDSLIDLPEGRYKVNDKEFKIYPKMITEIQ